MQPIRSLGYSVFFEEGSFKHLSSYLRSHKHSVIFILCDENTLQYCMPVLVTQCKELRNAEVIEVESGENSKSIGISSMIWQTLIDFNADKDALIINLGGGMISDLGGFTAALYKRGISFINIPTTLLAMADASVGGKTAIDFSDTKNVIGTFTRPAEVFINTRFLKTLNERQLSNGLAEIFKIALVSDKKLWKQLQKEVHYDQDLIYSSIRLKNKIVLKDPFDKGIRKSLNFGHTIGHAIEALMLTGASPLLHGEAILIGMIIESHLSYQKKLISKSAYTEIKSTFSTSFPKPSVKIPDVQAIIKMIRNDKKAQKKSFNFSLVARIGNCKIDVSVSESQIVQAINDYNINHA